MPPSAVARRPHKQRPAAAVHAVLRGHSWRRLKRTTPGSPVARAASARQRRMRPTSISRFAPAVQVVPRYGPPIERCAARDRASSVHPDRRRRRSAREVRKQSDPAAAEVFTSAARRSGVGRAWDRAFAEVERVRYLGTRPAHTLRGIFIDKAATALRLQMTVLPDHLPPLS